MKRIVNVKNLTDHNSILTLDFLSSNHTFFKRSISFEQHLINVAQSGNVTNLNSETYDLLFKNNTVRTGYLSNFLDKTLQNTPNSMYQYKKALNPYFFFKDNPHLGINVNPNDFNTLQQCNQRTSHIFEVATAKGFEIRYNEKITLTHGSIIDPIKAFNQTGQKNSDYYCVRVLQNGMFYDYYTDLKVTDKFTFLNKISSMHPNKLILCQVYLVGDLSDTYIFNTVTKNKLITGCDYYMQQHIFDASPISQYKSQFYQELKVFDTNPTVHNYNSLVTAPWRIFTVPSLSNLLNA